MRGGQRRLEPQHRLRPAPCRLGVVAQQAEHRGHVCGVQIALGLLILIEVVVAIGQAEAALMQLEQGLLRALVVRPLAHREEDVDACPR